MPYWPSPDATKEAGPYLVTCVSEREATDYKIRVFEISCVHSVTYKQICVYLVRKKTSFLTLFFPPMQPKQSRTVWHYQYMSWPDHGVPEEPGGVLSFLTQVNVKQGEFPDAGPMVIHCRYQPSHSPHFHRYQRGGCWGSFPGIH